MELTNKLTIFRGDYRYVKHKRTVSCLSSDNIGDPVYVSGNPAGTIWSVSGADPANENKMPAIGILISKDTPLTGVISLFDEVDVYTGLVPGKKYYVINGGISLSPPSGEVQIIGIAQSETTLFLPGNLGSGTEDNTDDDVLIDDIGLSSFYVGRAITGTATSASLWQVKKVVEQSGDIIVFQFADGSHSRNKCWDDRISYTYS